MLVLIMTCLTRDPAALGEGRIVIDPLLVIDTGGVRNLKYKTGSS